MPASQFTSQVSACLLQMSVKSSYFFCACVQSESGRQSWRGVVRNEYRNEKKQLSLPYLHLTSPRGTEPCL